MDNREVYVEGGYPIGPHGSWLINVPYGLGLGDGINV